MTTILMLAATVAITHIITRRTTTARALAGLHNVSMALRAAARAAGEEELRTAHGSTRLAARRKGLNYAAQQVELLSANLRRTA